MTSIVGILNLTPDSFSGDGTLAPDAVFARIDALVADGADVIDIGAESTRPNATPLLPDEEWARLAPVASELGRWQGKVRFSVDTRHAQVARQALASGFHWINDVSGAGDPEMLVLARENGCTLVLMHSLGVPASPQRTLPDSVDAVQAVLEWAQQKLAQMEEAGVQRSRIILDPGIGFGKTPAQSLNLIKHAAKLKAVALPLLFGHSRKSFLSFFTDKPSDLRDPETLAISVYLAQQGIDYLRVHDVKSHKAMLRMKAAYEAP